ncbi:MAG TPA: ABC transporter permease, partial [Bacillota bacterium]|nr:ABC transporter permease [Bacillota bacterium]
MTRYIVRRLLATVPVIIGITFIVFAMVSFAPGDPIELMLGSETVNPEYAERIRIELGLDRPWYEQYLRYMSGLLRGDMGRSIVYNRPVAGQVKERFANTAILAVSSAIFALLISI